MNAESFSMPKDMPQHKSVGCSCPANKNGIHEFESVILESTAPEGDQFKDMLTTLAVQMEDETLLKLVVAMSHRKYAVVCSACGMVAATCSPE